MLPRWPAASLQVATAAEVDQDEWKYRIATGDTLIGLTAQYLGADVGWRALQRLNHVADPYRLMPGSTLRIPVRWLRQDAAVARIVYVQGEASIVRGAAAPAAAASDAQLSAGDVLRTGAQSSLTLRFADGSRLLMLPDSEIAVERLLVYGRSGLPETQLRLERGDVDSQVEPQPGRRRGYQIRTPTVTLGVRGTAFRAHADAAAARVEVLQGQVLAAADRQERVDAGFGAVAAAGQPIEPPRRLLAAPDLHALAPLLERIPFGFAWPPVADAQGYRAQVFTAGEQRLLLDARFPGAAARFADVPDGRYVLRVRAIDAAGLEGLDASAPFVLDARPQPPFTSRPGAGTKSYGASTTFTWTRAAGVARYRLQVAPTSDFAQPLLDQRDIAEVERTLALAPGRYYWRVASIAADGDQGPFGDAQSFEQRAVPASPALEPPRLDADKLLVRWAAGAGGERYAYQFARDAEFGDIVAQAEVAEPQLELALPAPGRYYLRVKTIEADGFEGPFGAAQEIEVARSRWWWLAPAAAVGLFLFGL